MARFTILSEAGDGVGLAFRLKLEGHDAKLWCRSPDADRHGRGIVELAEGYDFGRIVVADCTGFGPLLDKFRWSEIPTFGGSSFHDNLEADRQFTEEVMMRAGIDVPRSVRVKSWDDAKKPLEALAKLNAQGKVVLKPEGPLSGSLPSYAASDVEDALTVIEHWRRTNSGDVQLTVQQFVDGQDVSTEGWFNGKEWIPGLFNHTLEKKHVLNGDLGPSGGCSGNVVWRASLGDPIVSSTLLKLTDELRRQRYVGCIDVNCVVNEKGAYGLEFTPRFGYDSLPTTLHTLADFDFGNFIEDAARGELADVKLQDGFGCGIRLSLPPWPSEQYHAADGIPIRGLDKDDWRWFYPYHVKLHDEELESSGGPGILGVINGRGEVIGEGFARAEEILSRLKIPDLQYRTDLGQSFLDAYLELERIMSGEDDLAGWYGVDLDGTLAWHRTGQIRIGRPILKMVERVKHWLASGKEVRVFTARCSVSGGYGERAEQVAAVYDWLKENLGFTLEVTCRKDPWMIELWDDRATEVEKNEGVAA